MAGLRAVLSPGKEMTSSSIYLEKGFPRNWKSSPSLHLYIVKDFARLPRCHFREIAITKKELFLDEVSLPGRAP